jgi:hypothetical protein
MDDRSERPALRKGPSLARRACLPMTRCILGVMVLAGCAAFAAWRLNVRAPTVPPGADRPPWFADVSDAGDGKLDLLFLVNNRRGKGAPLP